MRQFLLSTLIALSFSVSPQAPAQNSRVNWYGIDGGFASYASSGHSLMAVVGQNTAGVSTGAQSRIVSGFLVEAHGLLVAVNEQPALPTRFELGQNYPNPFNPLTQIPFAVPVASQVRLAVYDLLGREVAVLVNEQKAPGRYTVQFHPSNGNGRSIASGVYVYQMTAGNFRDTRKFILLK